MVLGMLDWLGPSTPYTLKKALSRSVEDFFPVPHTSFYAEPSRLAAGGYVSESQERGGRRRKTYALTHRGREALSQWLSDPHTEPAQFRLHAMLKTFFGADPSRFAIAQAEHHRELAEGFEAQRERSEGELSRNVRLVLETGIRVHRWWEATWLAIDTDAAGWERGPDSAA